MNTGVLCWSWPDSEDLLKLSEVNNTFKLLHRDSIWFFWHDTMISCKEFFGLFYNTFSSAETRKLGNKDLELDSKIHGGLFKRTQMLLLLFYLYVSYK